MKADDPRPMCRHCGKRPVTRPRGLCWEDFYSPARDLYKPVGKYVRKSVKPAAFKPAGACRHCERRAANRPRGLCARCYLDPAVRARHRPLYHEPPGETMAEVEAMIAEQMQCLPSWWSQDSAYMAELEARGAKIERSRA